MTETAHARFSPSSAHRWLQCAGSMVLESQYPDSSSSYAAEGTAAHHIASMCLLDKSWAADHVGKTFTVEGYDFHLDAEHARFIDDYIELVDKYAQDGTLLVEKRVDFSPVIAQSNSFGTADAIIAHATRLTVVDLKYGMGVKVDAEENPQLQLYALGALNDYGWMADFEEVTMVIHQPRINHVSEWTVHISDLEKFGNSARLAATQVLEAFEKGNDLSGFLNPGEKQCKFCRAKASCPAIRSAFDDFVGDAASVEEFSEMLAESGENHFAMLAGKVALAEQFIKAWRAEIERRIFAGERVPGFKIVEGRRGNRAWTDEDAVMELLNKKFRLKRDMICENKLRSPAQIEKLLKPEPRRWKQVSELISRADGKPSVAPEDDPRPAIVPADIAAEFQQFAEAAE